jgi:hypothetical protein
MYKPKHIYLSRPWCRLQKISLISTALVQTEYRADVLSFRLQPHSPGFVPRPVCVGLMVDKMAARQGVLHLHVSWFFPVTVIPSLPNSFVNLSPTVIDLAIVSVVHSKYLSSTWRCGELQQKYVSGLPNNS